MAPSGPQIGVSDRGAGRGVTVVEGGVRGGPPTKPPYLLASLVEPEADLYYLP